MLIKSVILILSASTLDQYLFNKKEKNVVPAKSFCRNEKPNEQSENTVDAIRNKVAATGANLRFSDIQWKQLAIGFLSSRKKRWKQ